MVKRRGSYWMRENVTLDYGKEVTIGYEKKLLMVMKESYSQYEEW